MAYVKLIECWRHHNRHFAQGDVHHTANNFFVLQSVAARKVTIWLRRVPQLYSCLRKTSENIHDFTNDGSGVACPWSWDIPNTDALGPRVLLRIISPGIVEPLRAICASKPGSVSDSVRI